MPAEPAQGIGTEEVPDDGILPELEPIEQSGIHFSERELTERSHGLIMLLRESERAFCYVAGFGRKGKLLPPDVPIPELACEPGEIWDVWEFNAEDEALKKHLASASESDHLSVLIMVGISPTSITKRR